MQSAIRSQERDRIAQERVASLMSAIPRKNEPSASPRSCEPWASNQVLIRRIKLSRSLRRPQVLEQVQPALARADQVEVAVAVDVDGGQLQAGAGGAGRESP